MGAILFGSSGSSGKEQWVVHTRRTLRSSAEMVNTHLKTTPEDVLGGLLPIYHVGGFGVYARAYHAGASCVTMEGKWNPEAATAFLRQHKVTITSLVPTQVFDLVSAGLKCPEELRLIVVGGGALNEEVGQAARDLGWPVLQSYGMSEAGSQVATAAPSEDWSRFRSQPLPILPSWEASVNAHGTLELSGPALCKGILRREGYQPVQSLKTQDRVEITENTLSFIGREDRSEKILGELVSLDALEDDITRATGQRVLVLSAPDKRKGVRLYAFSETPVDKALLDAALPPYVTIETVLVRPFPLSALGKLDRRALLRYALTNHDLTP